MIELPCSCGKKGCPNKIRLDPVERQLWIDHELFGEGMLIYSQASRLRQFAKRILRAIPAERKFRST